MLEHSLKYRITAFSLVLLMSVASVGWVVDFHYCQGELQRFSLFGKAATCAELAAKSCCQLEKSTCRPSQDPKDHKGCCENESVFLGLDADFVKASPGEQPAEAHIFFSITWAVARQLPFYYLDGEQVPVPYLNYKPPLLDSGDLLLLLQTFLC